jgi:hypothetical protein
MTNWTAEDEKLITLAKGARLRVGAEMGAALRDTTGRTYASAKVSESYLDLSAVVLTVGQAIASGATGIEAIVICAETLPSTADYELVQAFAGKDPPISTVTKHGDRLEN